VALADRWTPKSRVFAWSVTLTGLAVSVAANIGHTGSHAVTSRATAAVPPLAAAAALAVGLGVLKRVVEKQHEVPAGTPEAGPETPAAQIARDAEHAAQIALQATLAAGNPLSGRQLESRFGLSRAQASRVRQLVTAGANGYSAHDDEDG